MVKRHAGGALAASGGAGEVYRDFFYLSGRRRSAREVAATFFGRFVARDATDRFDPHGFLDRLGDKLGHAVGDEHGGLLSPDYMGRVIDLDFPAMRGWFAMDRVQDSGLWRRIACLEYLAQRLGSKLDA